MLTSTSNILLVGVGILNLRACQARPILTEEKLIMFKIETTLDNLQASIIGVLPHVSKDDVTPVITHAKLTVTAEHATLIGTDRYTVAEHTINHKSLNGSLELLIPRDALTDLTRVKLARRELNRLITLSFADDTLTLEHYTFKNAWHIEQPRGTFPPVERLFPTDSEPVGGPAANPEQFGPVEEIRLGWAHLAKFGPYMTKIAKNLPLNMRFTTTSNPNKPGPVLVTVKNHALRVLVQPNFMID